MNHCGMCGDGYNFGSRAAPHQVINRELTPSTNRQTSFILGTRKRRPENHHTHVQIINTVCCPNDAAKTAGICQYQSPAIATAERVYHCTQLQQNIIQYKITYRKSSSSNTYTHRFNGHSPRQPVLADGPLIFPTTGFAAKFSLAGCLSCDQPAETLGFTFSVTTVES